MTRQWESEKGENVDHLDKFFLNIVYQLDIFVSKLKNVFTLICLMEHLSKVSGRDFADASLVATRSRRSLIG